MASALSAHTFLKSRSKAGCSSTFWPVLKIPKRLLTQINEKNLAKNKKNKHYLQSILQGPPSKHALHDVSSVQAVDAVGAENTLLLSNQRSISGKDELAKFILLVRQAVNQNV
jgi:hypothetical protein